ncbi:MAG TPA: fasciclin domain-containing protein, partial [Phnomibacter sp.]|nr:fasciclin domain-containing protein [Phnomibacter sp.]
MKNSFFKLGRTFAVVGAIALLATSCQKEISVDPNRDADMLRNKPGTESIAALAIANGNFTQLVAALQYVDAERNTGLVDLFLNGKDQYTVFAPTDAAFGELYTALGVTSIEETNDPDLVLNVLLYH